MTSEETDQGTRGEVGQRAIGAEQGEKEEEGEEGAAQEVSGVTEGVREEGGMGEVGAIEVIPLAIMEIP